jgi:hypothetical protein
MKNNLVRAFVVLVALSGFGASTIAAKAAMKHNVTTNLIPMPCCAPSDPTYCGMK